MHTNLQNDNKHKQRALTLEGPFFPLARPEFIMLYALHTYSQRSKKLAVLMLWLLRCCEQVVSLAPRSSVRPTGRHVFERAKDEV